MSENIDQAPELSKSIEIADKDLIVEAIKAHFGSDSFNLKNIRQLTPEEMLIDRRDAEKNIDHFEFSYTKDEELLIGRMTTNNKEITLFMPNLKDQKSLYFGFPVSKND